MICVKVGKPSHDWSDHMTAAPGMRTVELKKDIMLHQVYNHDAFIINNAHNQPNICLFANLCKEKNKVVFICGNINTYTKELLDIADSYEKTFL